MSGEATERRLPVTPAFRAFKLVVVATAVALFTLMVGRDPASLLDPELLIWVVLIGAVEMLPVPSTRGLELTLSMPLLVAVCLLYPPGMAGLIGFAGSFDPREFRGETSILQALFNRSLSGLSTAAGAVCAQLLTGGDGSWLRLLAGAAVGTVVLYGASLVLTMIGMRLWLGMAPGETMRRLLGASPIDQLTSYFGLGLSGVLAARAETGWGIWAIVLVVAAILGARQMYFRNRALADQLAEQNNLLTEQAERLGEQNALQSRQAAQLERLLAEVRDNEERFRALVQNASDVIIVMLPDSTVTYQTPSAERVFGYGPRELVGTRLIDVLHPDDRRRALAWLAETARTEGVMAPVEWRMRHPRGLWQHVEVIGSNLVDDRRVGGIVLTIRSIEERRALTEQLRHQAFHDALTGLANRSLFRDRVGHALSRRRSAESASVAVMLLDLDDFKLVNDSMGHQAGDRLLVTVAERLRACLRPMDTAARLGGDEFAVLLEDVRGVEGAIEVAERIIDLLRLPVLLGGNEVFVHASVGIATNGEGTGTEDLLRDADLAMYAAKAKGKGSYEVFRPSLHAATMERMQLTADLQQAIDRGQLVVHFQPIVDLVDGGVAGLEALLRWRHPERGLLPPDAFVPLAEDSGLIVPIGQWVLAEACKHANHWAAANADAPTWVSVNLSARQLAQPDLVDQVRRMLADQGLPPQLLVLELTESLLMQDTEATIAKLHDLKAVGVRLAIDDFGTGYSSLSYLRRFPVDILKVGKSFIDGLVGKPGEGALAEAIINLGHTLQLATVAEGVASAEQASKLRALACRYAQGFYFFEPLPPEEVERTLAEAPSAPWPSSAAAAGD
jgi:diguanylate cyclase (GGDEF)-like protein/PAS domain S-box-containing protein